MLGRSLPVLLLLALGCQGTIETEGAPESHPSALDFEPIALDGGVDFVTDFVFLPSGEEFLALSKEGALHHLRLGDGETELLGTAYLPGVEAGEDCGALSLVLDPDFEENAFVYVGKCISTTHSGVFRYRLDPFDYEGLAATESRVIEVGDTASQRPWHNVGALNFDSHGNLWIPFGEKVRSAEAQDRSNNLGSLLRIVPSRDPDVGGYEPAPDNPFADVAGTSPDIYAYGLRSPWRAIFDTKGNYWFGDVGSDKFEEINVVTAPGQNFGWPRAEGPCAEDCDGLRDPIRHWNRRFDHEFPRDDPRAIDVNARVGIVALAYDASENDRYSGLLDGVVLYTDYCVGFVRGVTFDEDEVVDDVPLGHLNTAAAWRQGVDGYVYAMTFGRCQSQRENPGDDESRLYRAVPSE